jgi:uncharacterized alpha-E superfamily protein
MLARIAHQLYWVGRYVARAEHSSRLLESMMQASLHGSAQEAAIAPSWNEVMAVLGAGVDSDQAPELSAVQAVRTLTLDRESPASVSWCIDSAREGAKTVRDVIPREMWEALNTAYLELDASDLGAALRTGPLSVYSYVRERCALFWGLAEQTMLRDPAHSFLDAGRHVEAASVMLRVLRVSIHGVIEAPDRESDPSTDAQALALLQAVGGVEAFRRSRVGPAGIADVVAFLLFEPRFPNSVASSIDLLGERLREADANQHASPPLLRLTRLRAELEFHGSAPSDDRGSREYARALSELLDHVDEELRVVHDETEVRYFASAVEVGTVATA